MVSRDKAVGHSASLAAVFILSTAATATRLVVDQVNPFDLALFRFTIPAFVFLAILAVTRPRALIPPREDLAKLFASGLAFFAVFPILFNIALKSESASKAVILISTIPFWSLIIAAITGGGSFRNLVSKGALLTLAGILCLFYDGDFGLWIADALLAGCAILAAVNAQLTKSVAPKMGAVPVTAVTMFFGLCALIPMAITFGNPMDLPQYNSTVIAAILYLGFVPGCLGFYFRYVGISKIGPAHANWMPVFGVGFAMIVLNERPSILTFLALVLVVAGSFLINRR